jgi:hypothetical protein
VRLCDHSSDSVRPGRCSDLIRSAAHIVALWVSRNDYDIVDKFSTFFKVHLKQELTGTLVHSVG